MTELASRMLPLEAVFNAVKDRFAIEAPETLVVFGWKKPPQQLLQGTGRANRIAFDPGEALGEMVGARAPGRNPRPLRTLLEQCVIYCWAYDGPDSETANDEMAQWRAARNLLDATIRAIELSMRTVGTANLPDKGVKPYSKAEWVKPNTERSFGAELRFVLTLESAITDELPNLNGTAGSAPETDTTKVEPTNVAPSLTVEIAKTADLNVAGETDPPLETA
jgi:hypothetical protein